MTEAGAPGTAARAADPHAVSGGGSTASAEGLVKVLTAMGLPCAVEARGGLAIVEVEADRYARAATLLESLDARDRVLRAAREVGFTHVALELREEDN